MVPSSNQSAAPGPRYCGQCGAQNNRQANFCNHCGSRLPQAQRAPSPQVQQPLNQPPLNQPPYPAPTQQYAQPAPRMAYPPAQMPPPGYPYPTPVKSPPPAPVYSYPQSGGYAPQSGGYAPVMYPPPAAYVPVAQVPFQYSPPMPGWRIAIGWISLVLGLGLGLLGTLSSPVLVLFALLFQILWLILGINLSLNANRAAKINGRILVWLWVILFIAGFIYGFLSVVG